MTHFIIFDLEFTSWEDAKELMWTGPNQYREIIQIGALKIDRETFAVIDQRNILVKPKINPQLSDFIQKLTGVTQSAIDTDGQNFPEAYKNFSDFCGHALVFSYGSDMFILGENVALNHCHPYGAMHRHGMGFVNIASYINRIDPGTAGVNSGRLWQHFNLPKPADAAEHDALFDCHSILAAMRHLHEKGHRLPL